MACVLCGSEIDVKCPLCRGHGHWKLQVCPKRYAADPAIDEIQFAADQVEAGLGWPDERVRGWMHQPASLVDAVKWFWRLRGD